MGSLSETDTPLLPETLPEPFAPDSFDTLRGPHLAASRGSALGDTALPRPQMTLASSISCVGRGLHTGVAIRIRLHPAPQDHGIGFLRTDIADARVIPARFDHVVDTRLSTVVALADAPEQRVATIEHLMAALAANGIDNALVEVSGPELPVLDGSAGEFDFLLRCAGRVAQAATATPITILRRVRVDGADGAFAEFRPAGPGLSLALSIDFASAAIGRQSFSMVLDETVFRAQVANCRTFVERADIEALQRAGLARGGSLDNAIVVDGASVLNPGGLRRPDEFVRHKMLDAVGDLALSGAPIQGAFIGHKSGHGLNNQLLRAVFASSANWRPASATTPAKVRVAA